MAHYQAGWTLTGGTPPTLNTSLSPVAFNPFGPLGATPSFQYVTPRDLIDSARTRHWSFSDVNMPDGAGLIYLNQRQRELLSGCGAEIEGLVGTTVQYTVGSALTGQLISFVNGVPFLAAVGQDGWAMHVDANGVPFVDPSEPMVAADPFGLNGGVQGFPLPAEMVRLINVQLIYTGGVFLPCQLLNEKQRNRALPGRDPIVFVAGNRLIPMLPGTSPTDNSGDRWRNVTGIQISYIAVDTMRTLDDTVALPVVMIGGLVASLAMRFAMQAKECPTSDKQMFIREAEQATAEITSISLGLTGSAVEEQVLFTG